MNNYWNITFVEHTEKLIKICGVNRNAYREEIIQTWIEKKTLDELMAEEKALSPESGTIGGYYDSTLHKSISILNREACYVISVAVSTYKCHNLAHNIAMCEKGKMNQAYIDTLKAEYEENNKSYEAWKDAPFVKAEDPHSVPSHGTRAQPHQLLGAGEEAMTESKIGGPAFGLPPVIYSHWLGQISFAPFW